MGKIKLELEETSVKLIMEILTQVALPYNQTAPVISEMTEQLKQAETQIEEPSGE